jgi:hypothetical protein
MSMPKMATRETSTAITVADTVDVSSLRMKAGPLSRIGAALKASAAAGTELGGVEVARVRVLAGIARTGLALAEAKIKTAMVAAAMPEIGALTVNLNARTTAVDQALTNGTAAELITHIENRSATLAINRDLREQNKATEEEVAGLDACANADATRDMESSRQRQAQAKEAVQRLHGMALSSLSNVKLRLD